MAGGADAIGVTIGGAETYGVDQVGVAGAVEVEVVVREDALRALPTRHDPGMDHPHRLLHELPWTSAHSCGLTSWSAAKGTAISPAVYWMHTLEWRCQASLGPMKPEGGGR